MTTQLINIWEYRKNISNLWKKAEKENIKYLVMVHGKPAFEVRPVSHNNVDDDWTEYTQENHKAWLQWRKELNSGEALSVDLENMKSEDDFISFLKQ